MNNNELAFQIRGVCFTSTTVCIVFLDDRGRELFAVPPGTVSITVKKGSFDLSKYWDRADKLGIKYSVLD